MKSLAFLFITGLTLLFAASCKKDSFISSPNARLSISTDSLKFDTVFTSTGSVSQTFKIINDNSQKLLLSKVKLMGGAGSSFKMNVDGAATAEASNVEIAANDSIYVFVTVSINPNAANLPFIISDSIQVNYNGNSRFVQLQAYGQNAVFLNNKLITGNVTWTKTLPYVILGSLRIDTTATLTIQAGARIYAHANAPVLVDGSIIANGTKAEKIVFAGDRLDPDYKDLPAGWPGIYFRTTSKNNVLKFTNVKNAYQAVVVTNPAVNANPKLIMHQCIIDNAYDAGLYCINSSVQADNCLVTNCGNNVAFLFGGDYNLTNCTVAAYSNYYILHKNPVLQANNFASLNGTIVTSNLNAVFRNCIFWGDYGTVDDETVVSKQGANTFNVLFDRCLYKALADPGNSTLTSSIKNQAPQFDSVDISRRIYNFHISNAAAPGINKGVATAFPKDLDDNNRNIGLPDLGCYEKQ